MICIAIKYCFVNKKSIYFTFETPVFSYILVWSFSSVGDRYVQSKNWPQLLSLVKLLTSRIAVRVMLSGVIVIYLFKSNEYINSKTVWLMKFVWKNVLNTLYFQWPYQTIVLFLLLSNKHLKRTDLMISMCM